MKRPSRTVSSAQTDVHPRLVEVVRRHLETHWTRPVPEHTRAAFSRVPAPTADRAWVLDSGCGTGDSTMELANRHPQKRLIGIDQSSHRLRKSSDGEFLLSDNVVLCRAEFSAWVQLMAAAGFHAHKTYMLYPNPWPKPGHLQRRWHGHPVFPLILKTCSSLELRTNWKVYADEFHVALGIAGWRGEIRLLEPECPVSPFERKYSESGHILYQLVAQRP